MITTAKRLALALTFTLMATSATAVSAETANPSLRALNNMSRKGSPTVSQMSLGTVCPTVKNVTGNDFLWKSEISNHISQGDPRTSGPTFICGRICASKFPMNFYYSDGTPAGRVGYYGTYRANGRPRAYCAAGGAPKCSIADIAKKSKQSGRNGLLYLKLSQTACYKVQPLGRTGRL
jgi:hypothetical protein